MLTCLPRTSWKYLAFLACAATILLPLAPAAVAQTVWTQHNDNLRTGANTGETILNTSNVNQSSFGKLFASPVDGSIFTQPLYMPGLTINGGTHNAVFVATAANTLYAFDADNGTQLWSVNYGPTPQQTDLEIDPDVIGPIGIISTPVIDTATGTLYLVQRNKNADGSYHQFLRAVDVTSGLDKLGSPQEIAATFQGLTFDPKIQNQRAALTLANGTIYIAWASHNDVGDYHGWIVGYQASNVKVQQLVFATSTASGALGGIWMSGQGLIVDSSNNLYVMTGNGLFDGTANYGSSFLKLNSSLAVQDYFTPSNQANLTSQDLDLGSAGPLLIPGTTSLVGGGKDGRLFVVNTGNMGKFNASSDNVAQEFQASPSLILSSPVYWNSPTNGPTVYFWGSKDTGKAYLYNGLLNTIPSSVTTLSAPYSGGILSISSSGSNAGTGILWANVPAGNANAGTVTGTLHAYDATNLGNELWNSDQNAGRDDYGNYAKFVPPTIVNGKVYMATFSKQLVAYGLLGNSVPLVPASLTALAGNGQISLSWNATGGETSFNVYRSTTPGGEGTVAYATGITATTYTDTVVSNGTTYYYTIAGVSSAGTSSASNEASAIPSATAPLQINLKAYFNQIGIYNDGFTFTSNTGLDNQGDALSGTLLGARQTWNGSAFLIGPSGVNGINNVVSSGGNVIKLPSGSYGSVQVLATSVGNQTSQRFKVTYSDGSTSTFTQSMSDWLTPQSNSGEAQAVAMSYRNTFNGVPDNRTSYVYGYSFSLNTAKNATSITLPNNSNVKILAITLVPSGQAPAPDFGLTSSASSLTVAQGKSGTSTITVTALNAFSGSVSLSASGIPSGVTAAFSPASTATASTLTLSASSAATTGTSTITIQGTSGSLVHTITLTLSVTTTSSAGQVNLSSLFSTIGIYNDGATFSNGGLDGDGTALSGTLLGTSQIWNGIPFTIGPAGSKDVVSGKTNLTISSLPGGHFSTVRVLALAVNGNQTSQKFSVKYSDRSTTSFTQSISDWFTPQSYSGESNAITMSYRNSSNGTQDARTFFVYGYSFKINSTKTLTSITLPSNNSIRILAITLAP